ncbi:MAG: DUF5701 family protein, partial [Symbiobacteriaceae bacterium]
MASFDSRTFRDTMGQFLTGVTIVTAAEPDGTLVPEDVERGEHRLHGLPAHPRTLVEHPRHGRLADARLGGDVREPGPVLVDAPLRAAIDAAFPVRHAAMLPTGVRWAAARFVCLRIEGPQRLARAGIERGDEFRDVAPRDALPVIAGRGRSPLTIDEGISLVTVAPELLVKNRCFMLAGSTRGDKRVPAVWIAEKAPKLGW